MYKNDYYRLNYKEMLTLDLPGYLSKTTIDGRVEIFRFTKEAHDHDSLPFLLEYPNSLTEDDGTTWEFLDRKERMYRLFRNGDIKDAHLFSNGYYK